MRPIALNRKNALFAGHDVGTQNWAMLASIIETCKLNKVEPHANMTDVLTAIAQGHKQKYINSYSRGTLVTEAPLTVFLSPILFAYYKI
jgi:hypothetical protein